MCNLRPTSILLGVLVDKAVFIASALTLSAFVGVSSSLFQYVALACGLGSTFLGGFAAAWLARGEYLLRSFVKAACQLAPVYLARTFL